MANFILVHPAWLGAWSWDAVIPHLTKAGHHAVAVELPGHGTDRTPAAEVTMEAYVEAVTTAIDANGPAIVVGHSLAGIVISQAAEAKPEGVSGLVYVAAFLLPNGVSFLAATEGVQGSMVLDNLVMAPDSYSVTVKADVMHAAFAHDAPPETFEADRSRMVPEPTRPLATPLAITEERWGRIPRYYVECLEDRTIPPPVQKAMYEALPVREVFSMHASHAPNFSAPGELAQHLIAVAQDVAGS